MDEPPSYPHNGRGTTVAENRVHTFGRHVASNHEITEFGTGNQRWIVPDAEVDRQAIAPLRGYVYQLHQTLSAWIGLRGDDELYLEVAEDYAKVAKHPDRIDEILKSTQVKDTRESGSSPSIRPMFSTRSGICLRSRKPILDETSGSRS
jgi:hypothetical protein